MDIVDGEEDGSLRGQVHHQPVQTVQRLQQMAVPHFRQVATDRLEYEYWPREGRGALQQLLSFRLLREHWREQLADHAIGEVAFELAAGTTQHAIAISTGLRAGGGE